MNRKLRTTTRWAVRSVRGMDEAKEIRRMKGVPRARSQNPPHRRKLWPRLRLDVATQFMARPPNMQAKIFFIPGMTGMTGLPPPFAAKLPLGPLGRAAAVICVSRVLRQVTKGE